MLLNQYDQNALLTNANIKEHTTQPNLYAYRGDLVLEEGEIADTLGRRKPPLSVIKQVALLATDDKILFISGFLEKLEYLPMFYEKYAQDLSEDLVAVFYVENVSKPCRIIYNGVCHVILPMVEGEGTVWNDFNEELALEKTDFKGQSAADKVVTVYQAAKTDYRPKYSEVSWEEALAKTIEVKKELRGAI